MTHTKTPTYLRDESEIDATEWAKYYKAKRITDNKKLAAMLPAHIKRELFKPLPAIKYEFTQKFPSGLFTVLSPDSHRPDVFKKFYGTAQRETLDLNDPAHYIKAWNETNNYVRAQ